MCFKISCAGIVNKNFPSENEKCFTDFSIESNISFKPFEILSQIFFIKIFNLFSSVNYDMILS